MIRTVNYMPAGHSGSWDASREGEPHREPRLGGSLALPRRLGGSLALPGRTTVNTSLVAALILGGLPLAARAQPHHHDAVIGRSSLMVLKAEVPQEPAVLEPTAPGSPIQGWVGNMPGFEALEEDEPGEDFWKLAPGALIELEVLGLSHGLRMFDNTFSELSVGSRWVLGDHELHTHGLWIIDKAANPDPLLNPAGGVFLVRDLGTTGYGPSAPFDLTFIPEPASALLLTLAALVRPRRRG